MPQIALAGSPMTSPSPLMLCDRLLTLAMDADGAGFDCVANQLVGLAYRVLDRPAHAAAGAARAAGSAAPARRKRATSR